MLLFESGLAESRLSESGFRAIAMSLFVKNIVDSLRAQGNWIYGQSGTPPFSLVALRVDGLPRSSNIAAATTPKGSEGRGEASLPTFL
jgi:hypothetical protein